MASAPQLTAVFTQPHPSATDREAMGGCQGREILGRADPFAVSNEELAHVDTFRPCGWPRHLRRNGCVPSLRNLEQATMERNRSAVE
ncbi:hypothetical protein GCM10009574_076060 [Streptomyces asiaticus]|uniref:Uncharacterized protein n=2 Tax=Streptomyces rhizosphaericus TaxID=114699 RepID=A0ABP4CYU9_9ACTN